MPLLRQKHVAIRAISRHMLCLQHTVKCAVCHELSLSQTLQDVCSTYNEKCSVVTHNCIGNVMDVSNIHSTHNVQWV